MLVFLPPRLTPLLAQYATGVRIFLVYEICKLRRSTKVVASEYKISIKTVEKWITAYNKDNSVFEVSELPIGVKIKQLEKENARLKRDNEILKKTIRLIGKNE